MRIRLYRNADEEAVLELWEQAGINRPWLDLKAEIAAKRRRDRSLFLVAAEAEEIVGAVMGAFDGRRGWVYHLAIQPNRQRRGIGASLMRELERRMQNLGITKINLQVRADNCGVIGFYERMGYKDERLTSFGKSIMPQLSDSD